MVCPGHRPGKLGTSPSARHGKPSHIWAAKQSQPHGKSTAGANVFSPQRRQEGQGFLPSLCVLCALAVKLGLTSISNFLQGDHRGLLRSQKALARNDDGGEGAAAGISILIVLLVILADCGPSWQAMVVAPDGAMFPVDRQVLKGLERFAEEGAKGVPLERVLWTAGHQAVERVTILDGEGARHEFAWAAEAGGAPWLPDGTILIGGEELEAVRVEVEPPALLAQVEAKITDVAPTAAAALGLAPPSTATGRALPVAGGAMGVDHVLLLFLDGFGYVRYAEAAEAGLIPNLASLGAPMVGLTVYPPNTQVGSAALLTGAPPQVNGVEQRGIRQTELETLFDVATRAGLQVFAVEGNALAFNLRNTEMTLSGDRDGNGSTDDNVLTNALTVLETGMPDLFYVHFHGIDDAGHTYGPGAPEEEAAILGVDAAVGQLLQVLPPKTLTIIFADHGMHPVEEEEDRGNHEYLIARDMFIPVLLVTK